MANTVRILVTAKDEISGPLDKIRDKAAALGKTEFGKGIAQGLGQEAFKQVKNSLDNIIDAAADTIRVASDLNETVSKSDVIFGQTADSVQTWAETMDKAGGLSKRAALDAASGFAGLFKTVGVGIEESAGYAKGLTQMGADLASFFNTDVDTALAALKSGLNGESEPLRKFNVFLSDTAVTAKLTEMGIKKVGGQFTEAQKATARYQLIVEQTSDAQGDFARTSDGLANSQRILQAEIENTQAKIGQDLLPVAKDLSNWAADEGVPALEDLISALKFLGSAFGEPNKETKAFRDEAERTGLYWKITGQQIAGGMDDIKFSAKDTAKALLDFRAGERPINKIADAAGDATPKVKGLGGAAQKAADKFADLRQNVDDAAQAIAEAAYGPEELRLEFAKNRMELQDNERALGKVEDKIADLKKKGKPVPRELREQFIDLRAEVNDGKQAIIETGIKLERVGGIKMDRLEREFSDLGIDLSGLTGDAAALWAYIRKIANAKISSKDWGNWNNHGHAAGGYIAPYSSSLVNEGVNGAEAIFSTGSSGAYVNPSASAAGMGAGNGSPLVVQLVLPDGRVLAETVAPGVTAWQQDRRLVAKV